MKRAMAFLPAAAGFILLFSAHFALLLTGLLLTSVGLLAAPLGALYFLGFIGVASDFAPLSLALAGLCGIFTGTALCLLEIRLAPGSVRLFHRFACWFRHNPYRRVWHKSKRRPLLWICLGLGIASGVCCFLLQRQAVQNGFDGSVVKEEFHIGKAKYITISTTNLDVEILPFDGDEIKIGYVNDSAVIIEKQDENYLKLRQDDSFTFSLLAKEQFGYKMTVWLPQHDYRELYVSSSSGRITLQSTCAEYTELSTRSGEITVHEADGKLKARTDSGNISCNYLAFVTAGNFITESGNVEIRMPEFSGVTLEFETVCGSAESDMFGEAAREPVFRSATFERPAGLSHYLYVTTYSGKLKLYKLS